MPNYDFKSLSSFDFELLVRDLLQEEFHITLESFKAGRDNGIDLRYSDGMSQKLIVQCKHFAFTPLNKLVRHLQQIEKPKVKLLSPSRYVLATSLPLSPADKKKLIKALQPYCRKESDILGKEDLNNLLGKFPDIEKRNFKLWMTSTAVLQRIINADIHQRTFVETTNIQQRIRLYVRNSSFEKAQAILKSKHYCIISGIPGIGKTTLAEILCFDFMNKGYEFIKVTGNIEEAFRTFKQDKKQVFYYDDFLGQTTLRDKLAKNEEQSLLSFLGTVRKMKGCRFILTTREYILNDALQTYEKLARAERELYKCVIDLRDYTQKHRAQILYNHLFFSSIPKKYVRAILNNRWYWRIIRHPNYNPRIIDQMTDVTFLQEVKPEGYVDLFVKNLDDPRRIWEHIFTYQISEASRNLLIVLFSLPRTVAIDALEMAFLSFHRATATINNRQLNTSDFQNALSSLEGNFISIQKVANTILVSFHNPSVKDFLGSYLSNDSSFLTVLFQSFVYFDQCSEMWSVKQALKSKVRENIEALSEALFRTLDSSESEMIILGDTVVNGSDSRLKRLKLLVEVLDEFENESLHVRLGELLESVMTNVRGFEKNDLVELAKALDDTSFNFGIDRDGLLDDMRDYLTDDLENVDDYDYASDLLDTSRYQDEKDELSDRFSEFLEDNITYILANTRSAPSLSYYISKVEQVASRLGTNVVEALEPLNEKVEEMKQEAQKTISSDKSDRIKVSIRYPDNQAQLSHSPMS